MILVSGIVTNIEDIKDLPTSSPHPALSLEGGKSVFRPRDLISDMMFDITAFGSSSLQHNTDDGSLL